MQKNVKLTLQYDGTDFNGWQVQPEGRTVQSVLEQVLRQITGNSQVNVVGAGRTDSGVHAAGQVAHVLLDTYLTAEELLKAQNALLPRDIIILTCDEVPPEFHARYSARKREYRYLVTRKYSPFDRHYSWWMRYPIQEDLLTECAKMIVGEFDFTAFCKATAEVNHKICRIMVSEWSMDNDKLQYTIIGNRFLQHMVRYLVGTMMEVSRGRYSLDDFTNILHNREGRESVVRAPACGLFLQKISYAGE